MRIDRYLNVGTVVSQVAEFLNQLAGWSQCGMREESVGIKAEHSIVKAAFVVHHVRGQRHQAVAGAQPVEETRDRGAYSIIASRRVVGRVAELNSCPIDSQLELAHSDDSKIVYIWVERLRSSERATPQQSGIFARKLAHLSVRDGR
jgi:hypothetical protein